MTEPMPICVMYFPKDYSFTPDGEVVDILEMMAEFNGWPYKGNGFYTKDPIAGYFWLCFIKESLTEPGVQVFNAENAEIKDIEEIKVMVQDYLKTLEK